MKMNRSEKCKGPGGGIDRCIMHQVHTSPSLVIYIFATPPIKLKLGQQIGGGLLIANHLDQSL